ncbi:MAG TPA: myxococcus cysteine-rich repeat containing protein [Kofleriaceae bacterium]
MRWLSLVVLLAACVTDQLVPCGDVMCPVGDLCFAAQCVTADQISSCKDVDEDAACDAVTNGHCAGGICTSSVCGDSAVELGEVCDDGNQTPGDGCSADCRSAETCGNDVPDFVRGEECDRGVPGVSADGCSSTCTVEVGEWLDVARSTIGISSFDSAAAYDRARNRILLVVEHTSNGVTNVETWESVAKKWKRREPQTSPRVLNDHSSGWLMSYDSARARMVLFTTPSDISAAETWEWDGVTWTDMHPAHQPPVLGSTSVNYAAMAYDEQRAETVIAGYGQTWIWNGVDWTRRATLTSPPMADGYASLAYDRTRKVTVGLFGFTSTETWIWNGTNWSSRAGTTPPMGGSMNMTFNTVTGTVVGYGNDVLEPTNDDDVWTWSGSAWSMTTPTPSVQTRRHDLVFDESAGDLVVLGGYHFIADDNTEDWRLHGTAWTQNPTFASFDGNSGTMVYDESRGAFVVFDDSFPAGAYTYDGVALSALATPPSLLFDISECYSTKRRSVFASDGRNVVEIAGTTQTILPKANTPAGAFHSVVACDVVSGWPRIVADSATYVFDGTAWAKSPTNLVLDPGGDGFGLQFQIVVDSIRQLHVLYVGNPTTGAGMIWESPDAIVWTQKQAAPYRRDVSLVFDPLRQSLMLYGGYDPDSSAYSNEIEEWNGTAWVPLAIPGARPPGGVLVAGFDEIQGRLTLLFSSVSGVVWKFGFEPAHRERCFATGDEDGDGRLGCLDPDCWGICTPGCPPGTTCDPTLPHCGDGTCSSLEDSSRCPSDCP